VNDKTPVPVFAPWEKDCLDVLAEVLIERRRQEAKFGQQDLPDGTSAKLWKGYADTARRHYDEAVRQGRLTNRHILAEEFWEVMGEEDEDKLDAELTQVMGVCGKWKEQIRRRRLKRAQEKKR
jgi:hypothetical protein